MVVIIRDEESNKTLQLYQKYFISAKKAEKCILKKGYFCLGVLKSRKRHLVPFTFLYWFLWFFLFLLLLVLFLFILFLLLRLRAFLTLFALWTRPTLLTATATLRAAGWVWLWRREGVLLEWVNLELNYLTKCHNKCHNFMDAASSAPKLPLSADSVGPDSPSESE